MAALAEAPGLGLAAAAVMLLRMVAAVAAEATRLPIVQSVVVPLAVAQREQSPTVAEVAAGALGFFNALPVEYILI